MAQNWPQILHPNTEMLDAKNQWCRPGDRRAPPRRSLEAEAGVWALRVLRDLNYPANQQSEKIQPAL